MPPDDQIQVTQSRRKSAVFGRPVVDPAAWNGAELAGGHDWVQYFSDDAVADLEAMATAVRMRIGENANALLDLKANDFEIGDASIIVNHARRELQDKLGFILIRGLPIDRWDRLTAAIVYWAVGSHLGTPLSNNPQGDMLGHVIDLGKDFDHPQHRAYQTNATMFYHADQCDVVGLLCLQKSMSGGTSKVASSLFAHNVLWQRAPALAHTLTKEMCWSRLGEEGPDQGPWYPAPIFEYVNGQLSVSAGFKHIEKGHELPETPPLSDLAREGMLMFNDLCEEFHLAMDFEPGDIQFLNNYVCLHTRSGFQDWPGLERRRLLWRLWLKVPGLRPRSAYARNWENGVWAPDNAHNITLGPN